MPRMDRSLTVEQIQELIDARYREHDHYSGNNYRLRWGYDIGLPRTVLARQGAESAHPFGDAHEGPLPVGRSLYNGPTGLPCGSCAYERGNTIDDGCYRCRPELWDRCPCGRRNVAGHPCECWFTCEQCDELGRHSEEVAVVDEGRWSVRARYRYCGEECAESAGYAQCAGWDDDESGFCPQYVNHPSGRCSGHRPCNCGRCSRCLDRARIHSYSYKPAPLFKGEGPLYLGLECEIDVTGAMSDRQEIAEYVTSRMDRERIGYLKSDSSIDNGFELVTHPMSFDWAMDEFPWDMYGELTSGHGVSESDSCGIHVHVSRAGFADARHLYLWQKFFYRNAQPIKLLARRDSDEWAAFSNEARECAAYVAKTGGTYGGQVRGDAWYLPPEWRRVGRRNREVYGEDFISSPNIARYSAINVQNEHTLEVRIFAGSVDAQEVRAALGLVHASVEYTRRVDTPAVLKKGGWGWAAFADWTATRPEYDSLNREIERLVSA